MRDGTETSSSERPRSGIAGMGNEEELPGRVTQFSGTSKAQIFCGQDCFGMAQKSSRTVKEEKRIGLPRRVLEKHRRAPNARNRFGIERSGIDLY